jgi:hypothetical protein
MDKYDAIASVWTGRAGQLFALPNGKELRVIEWPPGDATPSIWVYDHVTLWFRTDGAKWPKNAQPALWDKVTALGLEEAGRKALNDATAYAKGTRGGWCIVSKDKTSGEALCVTDLYLTPKGAWMGAIASVLLPKEEEGATPEGKAE